MMNEVFPACAGVIRNARYLQAYERGFPRMRGGDPSPFEQFYMPLTFSPHARG